ncbi:MAG: hypothetical protein R3D85_00840 [Paracoccaceae bacterium]
MAVENWVAKEMASLTEFRRDLHRNPELLYDVTRTAATVAEALRAAGVDEVHEGIGRTGVVGVIRGQASGSGRMIGLRADMDALPITEKPAPNGHRRSPARCTPAAMTAIPPCCWARPGTWPKAAPSTAR